MRKSINKEILKMKLISIIYLFVSTAIVLSATGCSSSMVKHNVEQEFPLAITATRPAFIFPVSLHGVPGNPTEVGLAIAEGAVSEYGSSVISGQQLYKLVGNLSSTLGENIRRQVADNTLEMTTFSDQNIAELDEQMQLITGKLKDLGAITNKHHSFKYIIVLHTDTASSIPTPFIKKVTAFGSIMDLETRKIVSYIEKDITLAEEAVLGQMPVEMNKIIAELLNAPKEEA
jgi:hypothetical protein